MRLFIIFLFLSFNVYSQNVIKINLLRIDKPYHVSIFQANYSSNFFYPSLERYKFILPLDFNFRKNYFYYTENKRKYKLYL